MPITKPKVAGDNAYPRYQSTMLYTVAASQEIKKGEFYTNDSAGRLVVPSEIDMTGIAQFPHGVFQATQDHTTGSGVTTDRVQCFAPGTRVIAKAGESLVRGDVVYWDIDDKKCKRIDTPVYSSTATLPEVAVITKASIYTALGRVFDAYDGISDSQDSDTTTPRLTIGDDTYFILHMGMGW